MDSGVIIRVAMVMKFKRLKSITRRALAGFMAVWLSGIVLLFCCEEISARMADADSCPLAKMSPHCDKAKSQDSLSVKRQSNEHDQLDCCGFIPALLDKTRKVENNDQIVAIVPIVAVEKPELAAPHFVPAPVVPYRSVVLVRNDTFLRNLTFRI